MFDKSLSLSRVPDLYNIIPIHTQLKLRLKPCLSYWVKLIDIKQLTNKVEHLDVNCLRKPTSSFDANKCNKITIYE